MGTNYRTRVVVGFEVDPGWVYETTTINRPNCPHTHTSRFCPDCGAPAPKPQKVISPRDEALKALGREDADDLAEGLTLGISLGEMIIREYGDCADNRVILAGFQLLSLSDQRYEPFHKRNPVPRLSPDEDRKKIESFLQDKGIPYKPDSFQMHVIVEAS